MKINRCSYLFFSALIATLILAIEFASIGSFLSNSSSYSSAYLLGSSFGLSLIAPHLTFFTVGVIFNWFGYFKNNKVFTLISVLAYSVSGVILFTSALDVVISAVLSFIGYVQLDKVIETNNLNQKATKQPSTS